MSLYIYIYTWPTLTIYSKIGDEETIRQILLNIKPSVWPFVCQADVEGSDMEESGWSDLDINPDAWHRLVVDWWHVTSVNTNAAYVTVNVAATQVYCLLQMLLPSSECGAAI